MTALSEHLPDAFDLLGEVLRTPAFRAREVERLKAERLAELLQLRTEPRGLADELFSRFLYSPSSRYARPDGGDEQSVDGDRPRADARVLRERGICRAERRSSSPATSRPIAPRSSSRRAFGDWTGGKPSRVVGRRSAGAARARACTSSRRATRRSRSCESATSAFRAIIRIFFRST